MRWSFSSHKCRERQSKKLEKQERDEKTKVDNATCAVFSLLGACCFAVAAALVVAAALLSCGTIVVCGRCCWKDSTARLGLCLALHDQPTPCSCCVQVCLKHTTCRNALRIGEDGHPERQHGWGSNLCGKLHPLQKPEPQLPEVLFVVCICLCSCVFSLSLSFSSLLFSSLLFSLLFLFFSFFLSLSLSISPSPFVCVSQNGGKGLLDEWMRWLPGERASA